MWKIKKTRGPKRGFFFFTLAINEMFCRLSLRILFPQRKQNGDKLNHSNWYNCKNPYTTYLSSITQRND